MKGNAALIALVLALAGAVKVPFEASMAADRPSNRLMLSVKMREQIGQGLSLALLGGVRALGADFLWVAARVAWEEHRWFTMQQNFEIVTLLQPRAIYFWDMASWHLAWNASHAAANDPAEPRMAMRVRNQRLWITAGRELLERGIQNNPDNAYLHERLGWLLHDKARDLCGAADATLKAVKLCKDWRIDYLRRLAGYWLEECAREVAPARLREAYDYWRDLWFKEHASHPPEQWDTIDKNIANRIQKLENELAVPDSERIFPKNKPSASVPPAR
ncbi:MAG: hypothetical protein N2689_13740 [Verrucomicrobiae bacterium]|nr:hypothetical protein [Verrucomicrobiae bacterium]